MQKIEKILDWKWWWQFLE